MNTVKFTSGIDGTITATIYNKVGVPQDLTGCTVTLNLSFEYEDKAILSKQMTVQDTVCSVALTPIETEMLSGGIYELQLIIVDVLNKTNATEKQIFNIDKIIGV